MRAVYAVSVIAAVLVFVLAAVWLFVGVAGLTGTLPGNRWVGVRTKETIASKDAWTLAHRVAAPGFLGGALALILGGLLSLFATGGVFYALGGLVLGLLAVSVVSGVAIRAAQTVPAPDDAAAGCSSDCCSSDTAGTAPEQSCAAEAGEPAAECGESSCGSCALSGMCLPETQAGSGQAR